MGNSVGRKLKLIRQSKNLTQEDIASNLGVSLPAYSKMERDITDISLSRLDQLGNIFSMSVVEILSFGESEVLEREQQNLNAIIESKDQEIISLQRKLISFLERKSND